MHRARRVIAVGLAIIVVGLLAVALRTLNAMGLFTEVSPARCEDKSFLHGVVGPEDMQYDAAADALFISATDRRAYPQHPSSQDGIYVWRAKSPATPFRLKGTPPDFHPLGISVFRAGDATLTLMAVTYPVHGVPAIDVFDVSNAASSSIALHERESISGDLLVDPNDVLAIDKDRFYATNDHVSRTQVGLLFELFLVLPRANVVYFDGANFRVVANGLEYANGINRSPDGTHLYVAETTGREIKTYGMSFLGGDLTPQSDLSISSGLDNIDVTTNGTLYVAGHPKLLDFLAYRSDASKPSPSQIFRVDVDKAGIPVRATAIYSGTDIGASSVGVPVGERLLIGSVFDGKILNCALPK